MARLEQLQEAALREVIWTLGGSARCLEAAFGGARGILGFEDFVRGLRTIGFQAEDLEGCGFKDPAEAFRVLDRSGRGCLLIEEVTRRPEAKIRKLCGSGSLRRSASSDGFDMSIGSTGSDLYSAREDLENILGLLREREQEIQLLRTEMNSLKEQQDRHSAELLRAQRDLSLHHRSSIEQLQESQRSKDVEEFAHSAEAHHLNEKSRRNSERMLLEEQECLRMEVSRQQCLRVITEAEENMERCRLRHEDSVEYLHSLQEVYAELEVHGAQLKPSQGAALARELRLELEELNTLESQQHTEEAQEAELRNDLRQLRQEVMTSDKHRKELLTTVARGVSELSEELMAQHLSAKSELDLAEKKLSTVKRNTEAKVAELRGIKERMHEARLAAETESKEISQRSKEQVRKTLLESRQRDEEVQEEVVQLEHRHSEFGNGLGFLISEGSARPRLKESGRTMAEAEALRETLHLEKVRREGDRQMRERSQGRQGNAATELPELRAELNAAKERANDLALKCEQTWKKLTQEKRKAAAFAAESFEAAPLSVQPT